MTQTIADGLLTILEKLQVKNIIISKQGEVSSNFKQLLNSLKRKKIKVIAVTAGDKVQIDKECYFEILFPQTKLISSNVLNNNSIVAKFCMKNKKGKVFSMLFTGDIEQIAEKQMIELYQESKSLEATVLKVAHHGSKTSSTKPWLELVKPKIALIRSRKKQ